MPIKVRKSDERGHVRDSWLDAHFSFSFAGYQDKRYEGFSVLRVLNEDKIGAGKGFDTHPHKDFEIITYVINGLIEHKDSMGNIQQISNGGVQYTCAGKGILHSEYNRAEETAHAIQIWIIPDKNGIKPKYQSRTFTDDMKIGQLCQIIGPKTARGKLIQINQDASIFASILQKDQQIEYEFAPNRKGYIHVCMTGGTIQLNDEIVLGPGDGAMITDETKLKIFGTPKGEKRAEFLLFDLP